MKNHRYTALSLKMCSWTVIQMHITFCRVTHSINPMRSAENSMFQVNIMPPSSGLHSTPSRKAHLGLLFNPGKVGNMFLQNTGLSALSCVVFHPKKLQSSQSLAWEPQIQHMLTLCWQHDHHHFMWLWQHKKIHSTILWIKSYKCIVCSQNVVLQLCIWIWLYGPLPVILDIQK
jgi:hypothetical protein